MVRTWQRLKTGELLAQSLGEPTDWYQVTLSDAPDYELALSATAGVAGPATLDGQLVAYEGSIPWGTIAVVSAGVLVLTAGGWVAYRAYKEEPLLPQWASNLTSKRLR